MEFADLNEDIMADDWLISCDEIKRRRLIRRTPRFNIYKADWFGDVLLYEPVGKKKEDQPMSRRLDELSIDLERVKISAMKQTEFDSETDSAYSSISSTPQYNSNDEFQFPSGPSSPTFSSISELSILEINNQFIEGKQIDKAHPDAAAVNVPLKQSANPSPVILNKDSYQFGSHYRQTSLHKCSVEEERRTSWFELNELRLVAHDSFMLFMGASIDELVATQEESTSLVMQMNSPKATSLYNLLHATEFAPPSSPTDRFFAQNQARPQLSIETKFNICQQVINAMTYLHDKNIVHGKLTSVNIYIELNQRVKISLLDNEETLIASNCNNNSNQEGNSVQFNLPSLTYLSPELVRTLSVTRAGTYDNGCDQALAQIDTNQLTKRSDVFSFGTLLFELFEERFPFATERKQNQTRASPLADPRRLFGDSPLLGPYSKVDSPFMDQVSAKWNGNINISAQEIIYQVGSGLIAARNLKSGNSRVPALVKSIISTCWTSDPNERPAFKQLAFA